MDPSQMQAAMQKLQQTGLLPMLLQRFKQQQGQQAMPQQAQGQAPPSQPPQGGGATPQGGPQVKYDASGAGAQMTKPVPQPHEAFKGIMSMLTQWHERKAQKQDAEAENIANNLMDAVSRNDVAKIHDIINDPRSTKILDKVYKGWLTRSKESMMEPEKPEPGVKGFEHGIVNFIKNKAPGAKKPQQQQAQPQAQPQGQINLPKASPQAQADAATASARNQALKADPNLALPTQLNSGEQRQAELAKTGLASTPASEALLEKSKAEIVTAGAKVQEAQIALQKASVEAQKENFASEAARQNYLKSINEVDIARWKLRAIQERVKQGPKAGKERQLPIGDRLKWESLNKADILLDAIAKRGGGFTGSDVQDLQAELKAAGASTLASTLPSWVARMYSGKGNVKETATAVKDYKSAFKKALDDGYPNWQKTSAEPEAKPNEAPKDEDEDGDETVIDLTGN